MNTTANLLSVPEIRNYRCDVIDGWKVITYEQRQPGAVGWESVEIVVPPSR